MAVAYNRLNAKVRDKFGVDMTYTPAGRAGRTVRAIIDESYTSDTGGVGIQTETYILLVVDTDMPELAAGDGFTINAADYVAKEIKPDFFGMTQVLLQRS